MNIEFKGTQGEWEYEVDLDYDQGGNAIGLGPVVEVNGEVILKGITRDGTTEGCNYADVRLAAYARKLLSDLVEAAQLLRNYEKLHRSKGEEGHIKAERNKAWAEQFEATIAEALGEQEQ